MGFISEVFKINNDINLKYGEMDNKKFKIPFINKLIYDRNINKLKNTINKLPENILTMELLGEFADFLLIRDYTNYDFYYHIKQLVRNNEMAGSITFVYDLPDEYEFNITINFVKIYSKENGIKYHRTGDCNYCIYGPNSSSRFVYTEKSVEIFDLSSKEEIVLLDTISSTNTGKLYQAEKVFVRETVKCIKEFLNSNIGMRKLE